MANLLEGGRRISVVGSVVLKIGAGLAIVAMVLFALGNAVLNVPFLPMAPLMAVCAAYSFGLAIIGGVLLIAGWIVRGFGAPVPASAPRSVPNATEAQIEA